MNHSFNIDDAKIYGVECAILLENFRYWIDKNKANRKHFYDGAYWTYNSVKAFEELFPYWTTNQIRRYIEKLESMGAIKSGNYNNSPYDRTKWYCLNEKIDLSNLPNENVKNATSIYTNINQDINTDINSITTLAEVMPLVMNSKEVLTNTFETFWRAYPKKTGKRLALKAWLKEKPPLDAVLFALQWQKDSQQWYESGGKYIPNPTTYINQARWEDEQPDTKAPF